MATITGITAEKMAEITDAYIVDGDVVGDNLILTRYDGTTIDAGNVRGPKGDEGDPAGGVGDDGDAAGPIFVNSDVTNTYTGDQLTRVEHFRQSGSKVAQEDFTYNGDGTLATATKRTYATDGTTVTNTVTETYSYTSGVLTGIARTVS